MSKLYFPDRALKQAGFDQQSVEFFRGLFLRTGGSLDPATLDALETAVSALQVKDAQLNQSIAVNASDIDDLTDAFDGLSANDKTQPILMAQVKKLEHRINQLEDAI
tara:strand:- start:236 stop:556 length:321 start_codon:yes stop_codon:yes gene_type:complete